MTALEAFAILAMVLILINAGVAILLSIKRKR